MKGTTIMASSIMSLVLMALAVFAFTYGVAQTSGFKGPARWRPLILGSLSAGVLGGIAQCLRLLLEINGKL